MKMLEIKGLEKKFEDGHSVFKDLSFQVRKGEFVVVLGPSGTGKTTLLRLINGLYQPTAGSISVDGREVTSATVRQVRSSVGMVFQHFNLVPNLSALNNVLTGLLDQSTLVPSLFYIFKREFKLRALECLDQVGLLSKAYARVETLSGGQQQRVGIARAIVKKPVLLLADEPIASLDPLVAFNILALLKEINIRHGITVLCNLHQVDFAMRFAERIIGLSGGGILLDQPVEKVNREYIKQIYGEQKQNLFFGPDLNQAQMAAEIME